MWGPRPEFTHSVARASLFSAVAVGHTGFCCPRSPPVTEHSGKADRARRGVSCFFPVTPSWKQTLRSSERARLGSARGRREKPSECRPRRSKRGLDLGKSGQNEQARVGKPHSERGQVQNPPEDGRESSDASR